MAGFFVAFAEGLAGEKANFLLSWHYLALFCAAKLPGNASAGLILTRESSFCFG
ncbi:MAG: hypothetical protein ACRYFZ_16945 [Janthinobacterium lividum]